MKKGGMRGLGRLYKRPNSSVWWIRLSVNGKEYRESTGTTNYQEALAELNRRNQEKAGGTFVSAKDRRVTVDQLRDDLAANYRMRTKPSAWVTLVHKKAFNTLGDDGEAGRSGRPRFGMLAAGAVTTALLERAVLSWQAKSIAPATINKRMGTLKAAYYRAYKATPPKVTTVPTFPKRLPEDNARQGFFEKGAFFTMLDYLPDDGLRDFVEWGYWTGMRKGEISKLTWAAFNRETWTLNLPGKITKSGKPKQLALTGPFRAIIERRLAARRLDCPLIFYRLLHHGTPTRIYEFGKIWRRVARTAGLEGKFFHDLRRTGVRNMIRAGVDRKVAMRISGHRTENMFARYDIDTDADIRDAVEKVAAYVDNIPSTSTVTPIRLTQQ